MTTNLVSIGLPGRTDRGVVSTDDVDALLRAGSPVAVGVSGGKDSSACAHATVEHLNAIGHTGPRMLVHSDLGRIEWRQSLPVCERLATSLGLELVTVRRKAGDMMDRWLTRWDNNVARYADLSCVKLILPWSTPAMRFCTSELKTAVICRELVRRFPGKAIVSASGIRRAESAKRKLAPIAKPQKKLTNAKGTTGLDWNPIIEWSHQDVFAFLRSRDCELHEAYGTFGMTRVSCVYCIMSSGPDLIASAACPDNQDVYREMVDLEIRSTFSFQGNKGWLADVAPQLLDSETRDRLAVAKAAAKRREAVEKRIAKHLLYVKGWPTVMPTRDESRLLCEVRAEVADAVNLTVRYLDPDSLTNRYAELMAENARRS